MSSMVSTSTFSMLARAFVVLAFSFKLGVVVATVDVSSGVTIQGPSTGNFFAYDITLNTATARGLVSSPGASPGANANAGGATFVQVDGLGGITTQGQITGVDPTATSLFGYTVDTDPTGKWLFASYFYSSQSTLATEFTSDLIYLNNMALEGNVLVQQMSNPSATTPEIFACQNGDLPDTSDCISFGWSTSFDRSGLTETAIIGAPGSTATSVATGANRGNVFSAEADSEGTWTNFQRLPIESTYSDIQCGFSVSYQTLTTGEKIAVVGCPKAPDGGLALLFIDRGGRNGWQLQREFKPTDDVPSVVCEDFGASVLIEGKDIVVSCPQRLAGGSSKVYIYRVNPSPSSFSVALHQVIVNSAKAIRNFGHAMAMDGAVLIICAPGFFNAALPPLALTNPPANSNGACFLYAKTSTHPTALFGFESTFVSGQNVDYDGFGYSVAVRALQSSGNELKYDVIIGALGDYATGGTPANILRVGTILQEPLTNLPQGFDAQQVLGGEVRDSILDTNYIFLVEFIVTALAIYIATS
eukprot:CAMPEP_0204839196 /NCGR_PEP_ID=MMETSP1346-20131115/33465_1 /ASSEMBLY_ACC=CAM_ASM_000771 /TAXON_ID=215587 /ORGANISM="Aplanochytrium stocchinoi, Strain GSBS06" /LENGTH=529 /DNA_ID=CAMNT_0051975765 /DNA_START=108 /DNA_END=1697 /DNA_ORIENTATION=-